MFRYARTLLLILLLLSFIISPFYQKKTDCVSLFVTFIQIYYYYYYYYFTVHIVYHVRFVVNCGAKVCGSKFCIDIVEFQCIFIMYFTLFLGTKLQITLSNFVQNSIQSCNFIFVQLNPLTFNFVPFNHPVYFHQKIAFNFVPFNHPVYFHQNIAIISVLQRDQKTMLFQGLLTTQF